VYCRATRTPGTATTLMVDWNQSIKKQQSTNGQQINSNLFRLGIRPRNCKYFIIVSAPSNLDCTHQQHRHTRQKRMVKYHTSSSTNGRNNYKHKTKTIHTHAKATTPLVRRAISFEDREAVYVCVCSFVVIERVMHRICVVDIILTRCL